MRKEDAAEMITTMLHGTLSKARFKGSKLSKAVQNEERKNGAIFIAQTKEDLRQAHGTVVTSQEAVLDSIGASHWTPNVYRYGTYRVKGKYFKIYQGHEEENLSAITCFVVDVDYPEDEKPSYLDLDITCFNIQLTTRKVMFPTMILETPHGYQAYYVLKEPVWIRKTADGRFPALTAAKCVSASIRKAVATKNSNTDTGANHFGFFRMPSATNLVEVFEDSRPGFDELMQWSMKVSGTFKSAAKAKLERPSDQVHTNWFKALATAQVPNARKGGYYGRNNVLFTLCLAMYSSSKSEQEAFDFADEWNSNQFEPLAIREVRSIVRSAYLGRYQGAKLSYVRELCEMYAPDVRVDSTAHAWEHNAKPREERDYSHQAEWMQDLLQLVRTGTDRVRGHVRFTYRELEEALGISKQSLRRLLNRLEAMAAISIKRIKGCKGGLFVATAQMMADYVQQVKSAQTQTIKVNYRQSLETNETIITMIQGSLYTAKVAPYQRL